MKKLRLLTTKYCPKDCTGCCNKDWDLNKLPVVDDFNKYDEIIITGGEPLDISTREHTLSLINYIYDWCNSKRIIVYSAYGPGIIWLMRNTNIDGITYTIHDESDVESLRIVAKYFNAENFWLPQVSLRLNVLKGIDIPDDIDLKLWKVKKDIEWIPNCLLPKDEVFMKMPGV